MSTKHRSARHETGSTRVIFTLPHSLATELQQYANAVRDGNKSGFVADAIRAYIDHFRKRKHTQQLRQSYAASAAVSLAVNQAWEPLDDETWARLDSVNKPSASSK
jgi:hypothetical protein